MAAPWRNFWRFGLSIMIWMEIQCVWILILFTPDSMSGTWCFSLLLEALCQSAWNSGNRLVSAVLFWGHKTVQWDDAPNFSARDDVKEWGLVESYPLGQCAVVVPCGFRLDNFVQVLLSVCGCKPDKCRVWAFPPGSFWIFIPRSFGCIFLGDGNRFYSLLYFSSAKFFNDFLNWHIWPFSLLLAIFKN